MGNSIWISDICGSEKMFGETIKGIDLIKKTTNKEIEEEKKTKEQNRKLVLLLTKYDLGLECEWNHLLDTVIHKK